MKDTIHIGKGFDSLKIINLDDDYDEPKISFEKEKMFGSKEHILNDWQTKQLVEFIIIYLKSKTTFKKREAARLDRELKSLTKLKKEIESKISSSKEKKQ